MQDDWIREPAPDEHPDDEAGPGETDSAGVPADDPQAGQITRTDEHVADAARPTHPDVGGPFGPS